RTAAMAGERLAQIGSVKTIACIGIKSASPAPTRSQGRATNARLSAYARYPRRGGAGGVKDGQESLAAANASPFATRIVEYVSPSSRAPFASSSASAGTSPTL